MEAMWEFVTSWTFLVLVLLGPILILGYRFMLPFP
jgi:hypothetical protein